MEHNRKQNNTCNIIGCESYKRVRTKKIVYFGYPFFSKKLFTEWMEQVQNYIPRTPSIHDHICSEHFLGKYVDSSQERPKLKIEAIPTIFPHNSKSKSNAQNRSESTREMLKLETKRKHLNEEPISNKKIVDIEYKLQDVKKMNSKDTTSLTNNLDNMDSIKQISKVHELSVKSSQELQLKSDKISINPDKKSCKLKSEIGLEKNEYLKNQSVIKNLQTAQQQPNIKGTNLNNSKNISPNVKRRSILFMEINKIKSDEQQIAESSVEEVELDNENTQETVIFRLDPKTGKIALIKKSKRTNNNGIVETKNKIHNTIVTHNNHQQPNMQKPQPKLDQAKNISKKANVLNPQAIKIVNQKNRGILGRKKINPTDQRKSSANPNMTSPLKNDIQKIEISPLVPIMSLANTQLQLLPIYDPNNSSNTSYLVIAPQSPFNNTEQPNEPIMISDSSQLSTQSQSNMKRYSLSIDKKETQSNLSQSKRRTTLPSIIRNRNLNYHKHLS